MVSFTVVHDLALASILATLGCPIKYDSISNVRTGEGRSTIQVPSDEIPRVMAPREETGVLQPTPVLRLLRSGELAELYPLHEAMECSRTLYNHKQIVEWVSTGKPRLLNPIKGIKRCVYQEVDVLPADVTAYPDQFICYDIEKAASLAQLGFQITRIVGGSTFYMTLQPWALRQRENALHLFQSVNDKTLPEDHPYYWGMQVLKNRKIIADKLRTRNPQLHVTRLNSSRNQGALIDLNADKKDIEKQFDAARKHCGAF